MKKRGRSKKKDTHRDFSGFLSVLSDVCAAHAKTPPFFFILDIVLSVLRRPFSSDVNRLLLAVNQFYNNIESP